MSSLLAPSIHSFLVNGEHSPAQIADARNQADAIPEFLFSDELLPVQSIDADCLDDCVSMIIINGEAMTSQLSAGSDHKTSDTERTR